MIPYLLVIAYEMIYFLFHIYIYIYAETLRALNPKPLNPKPMTKAKSLAPYMADPDPRVRIAVTRTVADLRLSTQNSRL